MDLTSEIQQELAGVTQETTVALLEHYEIEKTLATIMIDKMTDAVRKKTGR